MPSLGRIDPADGQARHLAAQSLDDMRGRIGRGQQDLMPAICKLGRDGCGHRRLADAALAHEHEEPLAGPLDLIDEHTEPGQVFARRSGRCIGFSKAVGGTCGKAPERFDSDEILRAQRKRLAGKLREAGVHGIQRSVIPLRQGRGQRIAAGFGWHHTVDRKMLVLESNSGKLP